MDLVGPIIDEIRTSTTCTNQYFSKNFRKYCWNQRNFKELSPKSSSMFEGTYFYVKLIDHYLSSDMKLFRNYHNKTEHFQKQTADYNPKKFRILKIYD